MSSSAANVQQAAAARGDGAVSSRTRAAKRAASFFPITELPPGVLERGILPWLDMMDGNALRLTCKALHEAVARAPWVDA